MNEQYLPITAWAEDEKPREKLLKKGVMSLSTTELLAVIVRLGKLNESALDLSRRILSDCGNDLNQLAKLSPRDLIKRYNGIGIAKACGIVATLEISRRRAFAPEQPVDTLYSSIDAYRYITPMIGELDHEEFWVVYLSRSSRVLGSEMLSSGGMSGTVIDIRILFRKALEIKASAILVAHNHPSGSLRPSEQDKAVTEKIREAGKIIDITLYDHLIIGSNAYFSFVDEDILVRSNKMTQNAKRCRKNMSD